MYLEIPENFTESELKATLTHAFPKYNVASPPLFKRTTLVASGLSSVTVQKRNRKLKLTPTPNTKHPGVIAAIVLGVIFGLLPAVVVIIVLFVVTKNKNEALAEQVADFMKQKYTIQEL